MISNPLRNAISRGAFAIPILLFLAGAVHGAEVETSARGKQPRYFVVDIPSSLGGTASTGRGIDDLGIVTGFSNLPGNQTRHATLWLAGFMVDLKTLGGPNSAVLWPAMNSRGMIVGISETAEMDPRNENWSCSAFFPARTGHVCRGFIWQRGVMRELPTLGGTHSFATGANNRGQIVGWAENTVEDPTCEAPQVLQFRGVVWNAGTRRITRELDPLPGDTVTTANAINDRGQIVGISGICDQAVGRASARHAVLWENGAATDLGNLGAELWNTPVAINQQGHIVGFGGDLDEDGNLFIHAFSWTKQHGIEALPRREDDVQSEAWSINERRQVVGLARNAAGLRAVLWQDGVMLDLNDLVQSGYRGHLRRAHDINERGTITGQSVDPDTGEMRAFVAIRIP